MLNTNPASAWHRDYLNVGRVGRALSVLILAMAIFQAFLACRWRERANGTIVLGIRRPTHRKLGFTTPVMWYFSFFTGIIIYAILYVL